MMAHERSAKLLSSISALKKDLPFSPQVLTTLYAQTDEDSNASLSDIAHSIAADQGLTVKVLKMANSAYYGLQSEVESPTRAVALLGLETIRCLVMSVAVKGISAKLKPGVFDLRDYWHHQLLTAATAKLIASSISSIPQPDNAPPLIPDQIFTAAMLHDIGKLLTAILLPDDWLAIAAIVKEKNLPCCEAEDEYWGLEHGVIGSMALSAMNLPALLTEPVNWHHAPDNAPEHSLHAKVICLADALAIEHAAENRPIAGPWQEIIAEFNLDHDALLSDVRELAEDEGLTQLLSALA